MNVVLSDSIVKCAGCTWHTTTMRDDFERFSGFVAADAMKHGINQLDWPCMALTMHNETPMICAV